ncbi:MAG: hypothetical protein WC744_05730 [Patescibacteria group bacterium]|jgi:hypothetical protein
MIKILTDQKMDKEVGLDFLGFSAGGMDFDGLIKRDHPNFTAENADTYVPSFYNEHKDEIEKSRSELSELLTNKEEDFFSALQTVFHLDLRNEEYKGYVSIFDLNPRFPETLSFQVCYRRPLSLRLEVAIHEITHFAFFKFCDEKIPETKGKDKNSGLLWELSEVLNVILLNTPSFRAILGEEEKLFYPGLQTLLDKGKNIFEEEKGDIAKWVMRMSE